MTQHEIIKRVLEDTGEWTPSYKLIMVDTKYGWLGSSGDRRARELFEKGEILRRQNGKYAEYKTKEEERCIALTKIMEIRKQKPMSPKQEEQKHIITQSLNLF